MPSGDGARSVDAPDDYALADLSDALRHLLPGETPPDEAVDAARVAVAVSGRGERGALFRVAAARCDRGAGCDDLRAGTRGDGRGGDCGHAGGQRSDDGDLQPAVQYGDRVDSARRAFAGRNWGLLFHADTGPHRVYVIFFTIITYIFYYRLQF